MNSKKKKYFVCRLEDLKHVESYGQEIDVNGKLINCLFIYQDNHVHSYINRCPHTGVNLEWVAHQFLDNNHEFIQCATHGALFDIKNGICLRGPCVGERLELIENVISEGNIYLIL